MTRLVKPAVTVIIPVYNSARYLAEAIDSALAQTRKPLEIVVVDDGSTDGSGEVARRFAGAVRYDSQPHGGAGAARNRGVRLAHGDYLAFLDADDVWIPDKLERQMAAFDAAAPDAVFGMVEQFVSPDLPPNEAARVECPANPAPGRLSGTMLITRAMFERVGWFSATLRIGEFIDWYARATELGITDVIIPHVVLRRRIHGTNQGILRRDARSDYARLVKAAMDRRRAFSR